MLLKGFTATIAFIALVNLLTLWFARATIIASLSAWWAALTWQELGGIIGIIALCIFVASAFMCSEGQRLG